MSQLQTICMFNPKNVTKLSNIWVGYGIRKKLSRNPNLDPGHKKHRIPISNIVRNFTESKVRYW